MEQSHAAAGMGQWVLWIGRRCWPHPHVLIRRGGDERLLRRSVFVDPPEPLWALDLALRCPAVLAVVADGSGLDMAATRRLQLAAEAGGTLALLARPPHEIKTLSAAATRWHVRRRPSPGRHPQWAVDLVRCKGVSLLPMADDRWPVAERLTRYSPESSATPSSVGHGHLAIGTFLLRWTRAQGAVLVSADVVGRSGATTMAPAPRRVADGRQIA